MVQDIRVDGGAVWVAPDRYLHDATVCIARGRIDYVGPSDAAPDDDRPRRTARCVLPGFVDRHVHIGLADPAAVVAAGVTTVRDLAWPPWIIFTTARLSRKAEFLGPRIDCCGPMITVPGGYPSQAAWAPAGTAHEVAGLDDARQAVHEFADDDAIEIKIALNAGAGPTLSDEQIATICDAAHERGLDVTAHVEGEGQTERALRLGVDELAHTPWTERLDDDLITELARRCRIVSTLDIQSYGERTEGLAVAIDNLGRFYAAGGHVLYGTDLGNGDIPAGVHPREIAWLSEVGMPTEAIISAMTPGRLCVGMDGDVVALSSDPRDDLQNLVDIDFVVRSGVIRQLPVTTS